MKWVEGTILGFAKGRLELNRAVGMLRRALDVVKEGELRAIFANIESNPIYLPSMTPEKKKAKVKPLREALGC